MAVKGLDAGEQLAVVADGDEDLDAVAHGGLEDGEGPRGELVLLELRDLVLTVVRLSAPCSPPFCVGVVTPASGDGGGGVRRGFLRRSFPRRGEGREVGAYVSSFRDLVRSSLRSLSVLLEPYVRGMHSGALDLGVLHRVGWEGKGSVGGGRVVDGASKVGWVKR